MNLFEQLLIWLYQNKLEFTITTGLAYGHKIYKTNGYTFIELDDTNIMVSSKDCKFNYRATTFEEVVKLLKALN
jgi:hypothetical protein